MRPMCVVKCCTSWSHLKSNRQAYQLTHPVLLPPPPHQGFSAPSHDDKLLEVVGITGMTQVATSKVLGIQNRRITQCRVAKLTLNGSEKFPVQVDGEAWLQDPGTVIVSHKNKARMLVKDKVR